MLILTVNAGSTSVRLGLFEASAAGPLRRGGERREAAPGDEPAIMADFASRAGATIDLVVHRVVHAGPQFRATCRFDADVRDAIQRMTPLAPLHNPPALAWAAAGADRLPAIPHLAAFDSAFYRNLPAVAATYGLPADLAARTGLTRLGFHGLAHQSMWESFRALRPGRTGRVISLQLGGGCSATALRDGQPIDTSMGFSPLEGLMMATRPGDLDPGALLHLLQDCGLDRAALLRLLNHESGLRGISGHSGDVRQLLRADTPAAALALDVYGYRIRKYVGAYWAALGGCDAILVGGGAGEGSAPLRARIFEPLAPLGVIIDHAANAQAKAPACINTPGSPVELWVLATDEERLLAREGAAWLTEQRAPALRGGA